MKILSTLIGLWFSLTASASLLDPAAPPRPAEDHPAISLPSRITPEISDALRLEETGETDFAIPIDEVHSAAGSGGSRLITGTQDGELAAFRIRRTGSSYEVVELGKEELAWQLSKIILSWTVVACLLFGALFSIAEKSKRARARH